MILSYTTSFPLFRHFRFFCLVIIYSAILFHLINGELSNACIHYFKRLPAIALTTHASFMAITRTVFFFIREVRAQQLCKDYDSCDSSTFKMFVTKALGVLSERNQILPHNQHGFVQSICRNKFIEMSEWLGCLHGWGEICDIMYIDSSKVK